VRDQFREKINDLISNLDLYMMFPKIRDHLLGTIKEKAITTLLLGWIVS
jgi:hypothetical protein